MKLHEIKPAPDRRNVAKSSAGGVDQGTERRQGAGEKDKRHVQGLAFRPGSRAARCPNSSFAKTWVHEYF